MTTYPFASRFKYGLFDSTCLLSLHLQIYILRGNILSHSQLCTFTTARMLGQWFVWQRLRIQTADYSLITESLLTGRSERVWLILLFWIINRSGHSLLCWQLVFCTTPLGVIGKGVPSRTPHVSSTAGTKPRQALLLSQNRTQNTTSALLYCAATCQDALSEPPQMTDNSSTTSLSLREIPGKS